MTQSMDMDKIAIVGMGYVGLPLALQFCRSGVSVTGVDIDPAKVAAINQGFAFAGADGLEHLAMLPRRVRYVWHEYPPIACRNPWRILPAPRRARRGVCSIA